jgi:hypothetical protein
MRTICAALLHLLGALLLFGGPDLRPLRDGLQGYSLRGRTAKESSRRQKDEPSQQPRQPCRGLEGRMQRGKVLSSEAYLNAADPAQPRKPTRSSRRHISLRN